MNVNTNASGPDPADRDDDRRDAAAEPRTEQVQTQVWEQEQGAAAIIASDPDIAAAEVGNSTDAPDAPDGPLVDTFERDGVTVTTFGAVDARALEQLMRCAVASAADYAVLCADHHIGYSQPIGGAIAAEHTISPSGVGYDIGCGNKAVRTNILAADVDIPAIVHAITRSVSFGMGRTNNERLDHPVLEAIRNADLREQQKMTHLAANQLGTVGGGNHYVDLFSDEHGYLWVGVHFGSRGFGHKTATGFLALGQGLQFTDHPRELGMDAEPTLFDTRTDLGQAYIAAMQLAGDYAYAGRDVVTAKVLSILGASAEEEIHNHHNYAWLENHFGRDYWVVRKGCTPAFPGQTGFVGASMGGTSVILEGQDTEESRRALASTVHGAGRVMSRRAAIGKTKRVRVNGQSRVEVVTAGLVDWNAVKSDLTERGIVLKGGGADEAPPAYKNLDDVLTHHTGSIRVNHRLRPLGVVMARSDVHDPYRD